MRKIPLFTRNRKLWIVAERFSTARSHAIGNYMHKEAGIPPLGEKIAVARIAAETWPFDKQWQGFWTKVRSVSHLRSSRRVPFIALQTQENALLENRCFVHEYFGHGWFRERFPFDRSDSWCRVDEAYARLLETFVSENRQKAIADTSSSFYLPGTSELTQQVLDISLRLGKRATMQLFSGLGHKELSGGQLEQFIHVFAQDQPLLSALATLAARYGGEAIMPYVLYADRENVLRDAIAVYDGIVQHSSSVTEDGLMRAYLQDEFSLGKPFADLYLRTVAPSCLEELISEKALLPKANVYAIDRASALKWVGAHAGSPFPDPERGMKALTIVTKACDHLFDLDGKDAPHAFQRYLEREYQKNRTLSAAVS